jgi:hypothetical protein
MKDFGNFWVSFLLRSPLHGLLSRMFLVITFRGRKSGRLISTPVNYWEDGRTITLTSRRNRNWWRNLRGGATVQIRLRGKNFPAQAEVIETPEEIAAGFRWIFSKHPAMMQPFGVEHLSGGDIRAEDLTRLTNERVLIRLTRVDSR